MSRPVPLRPLAWLPVLLALPLHLQALAAPQVERAIRAQYRCLGPGPATEVTALFFNQAPAAVVLLEGDTALRLPQALAASGARYAAGDQEFWIKSDQARWRQGAAPPLRCGPQPEPGR